MGGSRTRRWGRTAALGAAAGAAVVAAAVVVPEGDAPAYAAEPAPVVKLEKARKTVTAYRAGKSAYVDLGMHVTAGIDRPFEVRVVRPDRDYTKKLVATLADGPQLPEGSAREDWAGLDEFLHLTVTNAKNKVVVDRALTFCPNSYEQVRRQKEAPSSSPYPYGCRASSFGFGQVWGLERGFSTPAFEEGLELPLALGTYQAKLEITEPYRTALGLTTSTAQEVTVKVVKPRRGSDDFWRSARTSHSTSHSGMAGMHHGSAPMRHTESTWGDRRRSSAFPAPSQRAMEQLPEVTSLRDVEQRADLPDLESLPAWGMRIDKGRYLQFSATVWNAGPSPLVVDGFRTDDGSAGDDNLEMSAFQYFYDEQGDETGYAPVGTMEWDAQEGHNHWHFRDFAKYELLRVDKSLAVKSQKEAFCLANTDVVDFTLPGADWRPENTDLHTSCGRRSSVALRQVLDAGGGDTYMQYLPGQSFDLKGVPDGTYLISVDANPNRTGGLFESDYDNNQSTREVVIGTKAGKRTVSYKPIPNVAEPGEYEDW